MKDNIGHKMMNEYISKISVITGAHTILTLKEYLNRKIRAELKLN